MDGSGATRTCWGSEWQSPQGFVLPSGRVPAASPSPLAASGHDRGCNGTARDPSGWHWGTAPQRASPLTNTTLLLPQSPSAGAGLWERPQTRSADQGLLQGMLSTVQGSRGKLISIYPLGARVKSQDSMHFGGATAELWGKGRRCSGQTTTFPCHFHCQHELPSTGSLARPAAWAATAPTPKSSPGLTGRNTSMKQTARLNPLEEARGVIPRSICPAQAGDTHQERILAAIPISHLCPPG